MQTSSTKTRGRLYITILFTTTLFFGKTITCSLESCGGKGTCWNVRLWRNNSLTTNKWCECQPNYSGDNCQFTKCGDSYCGENGVCKLVGISPQCECDGGTCQFSKCGDDDYCNSNGECWEGDSKWCKCHVGYGGKHCNVDLCNGMCGEYEVCHRATYPYIVDRCECKENYYKAICYTGPCTTTPCNGNGKCEMENNRFICKCHEGYHGESCEKSSCTKHSCNGNGLCVGNVVDGQFKCKCKHGFSGKYCENEKVGVHTLAKVSIITIIAVAATGMVVLPTCYWYYRKRNNQTLESVSVVTTNDLQTRESPHAAETAVYADFHPYEVVRNPSTIESDEGGYMIPIQTSNRSQQPTIRFCSGGNYRRNSIFANSNQTGDVGTYGYIGLENSENEYMEASEITTSPPK